MNTPQPPVRGPLQRVIDGLDQRLGLSGKLMLALAAGSVMTLVVATTAWLGFRGLVTAQRDVVDGALPALQAVQAVARLNTTLAARVQQMGRAESSDEVGRLQASAREQLAALGEVMQRLQHQQFERQQVDEAGRTLQAIAVNVEQQADAMQQLLQGRADQDALLAEQRHALTALGQLSESLAANASSATAATIAGIYPLVQRGAASERVLESLDRLAEVDIDRQERVSELQLTCFNLKTLLERLDGDAAPTDDLRQQYMASLAVLGRRLLDVRDPQRRASALGHRDVLLRALAPAGLFAARARHFEQATRLRQLRADGAALALQIGELSARLAGASSRAIEGATGQSREAVDRGMASFLTVAALLFGGLMLVMWLILRSHLVGRLREMEFLVRDLGRGRLDVEIRPRDPKDPLAPMARALEQFRANASERLRLEQALLAHQQELEMQVRTRTSELRDSNALLAQEAARHAVARQQAEDANRAKNEFLGTLSHELRTPLAGVDGTVQLLRDTPLDDRQREYLRMIGYANTTLLEIVDEMLSYSRLEGGRITVEHEAFDLHEAVDDMLALQWVAARAKGVALVRDIAPDVPQRVVGDRRKLNQVLLNTIGNAVKFTDEGEVRVAVRRATPAADAALSLSFEVIDTGIGIPEAQREAVFEPFVQVEDTAHRRHGGTGLGLAVCKRLVTLLGGQIGLRSVLGQGTTVHFDLPFERAAADLQAPDARPDPAASAPRSLSVLVVEDDEINRTVCLRHLEALGHRPQAAGDGDEALALLQRSDATFDLVLMDVSLPGESGFEVTGRIRRLDGGRLRSLPIVAMSAHLPESARQALQAADVDGFLPKPFERALLARTLAAAMARGGAVELPAAPPPADALLDDAFLDEDIYSLGAEGVARLLDLFSRNAELTLVDCDQALAAGDRDGVARHAHRLASAAGNLGFARLVAHARRLELTARDTGVPMAAVAAAVQALKPLSGASEDALARRLRRVADQAAPSSAASM